MTNEPAGRLDSKLSEQSDQEINEIADSLEDDDRVLFNDRSNALEVKDRHEKPITKSYRRRSGTRDHYEIVELKGNGTRYHLLWQHGSGLSPMLYKESEWEEPDDEDSYHEYPRGGERVSRIEVVERGG